MTESSFKVNIPATCMKVVSHLQNSLYPHLAQDEKPQDKIAQLNSALTKLRSSASESRAQRDQKVYDLWTLSELMSDPYCCNDFMSHNALPIIVTFLAEDNSAGKTPAICVDISL